MIFIFGMDAAFPSSLGWGNGGISLNKREGLGCLDGWPRSVGEIFRPAGPENDPNRR